MFGYKAMWNRLKRTGITFPRISVRYGLDPEAIAQCRKRRLRRRNYINPGPNFAWHVRWVYDKLKPLGAIDGYSRKIIWLEVGKSTNNPMVMCAVCYEV